MLRVLNRDSTSGLALPDYLRSDRLIQHSTSTAAQRATGDKDVMDPALEGTWKNIGLPGSPVRDRRRFDVLDPDGQVREGVELIRRPWTENFSRPIRFATSVSCVLIYATGMPLGYDIYADIGLLYIRGQGVTTQRERMSAMLAWLREPQYENCTDALIDFTDVTAADHVRHRTDVRPAGSVARSPVRGQGVHESWPRVGLAQTRYAAVSAALAALGVSTGRGAAAGYRGSPRKARRTSWPGTPRTPGRQRRG